MIITTLDWTVIALFFIITLFIGLAFSKSAGESSDEFFLGGRKMPWWLLGISMVATTFSADTPNLVTGMVREGGVSANWAWWAFLLTGMLTVFVYAKLWRRSGIATDLEFYDLRYSGSDAKLLRYFRAIYLGVFFNVVIMATVLLAGVKISAILLGMNQLQTVLLISVITVIYSSIGGFKGVVYTDFVQFILAMAGMIIAAVFIVNMPEIGGLDRLLEAPAVASRKSILPDFSNTETLIPLLIIPLAVQWWSVWYPGAEPGGGGYIAQRMLSAKDEKNAVIATFLFNFAHYALRPWPWILIAFASLVLYPDLDSLRQAFPDVDPKIVKDDLAFPAMMSHLPSGLIGLIIAALTAALMSTISTHLNWGSSYVVNDFYTPAIKPNATDKEKVWVGRITTIVLMILAALLSFKIASAQEGFDMMLQIGAGTGLLFILRWFWWRINAKTEIMAMTVSFAIALILANSTFNDIASHWKLVIGVILTTIAWIATAFLTAPSEEGKLKSFYATIRPLPYGWKPLIQRNPELASISAGTSLGRDVAMMLLGSTLIYSLLFALGFLLYKEFTSFSVALIITALATLALYKLWKAK